MVHFRLVSLLHCAIFSLSSVKNSSFLLLLLLIQSLFVCVFPFCFSYWYNILNKSFVYENIWSIFCVIVITHAFCYSETRSKHAVSCFTDL